MSDVAVDRYVPRVTVCHAGGTPRMISPAYTGDVSTGEIDV
jgi:hypothetical protein